MISLWNAIVYKPLYNTLILLVGILPGQSVGTAIIVLTFLVKLLLYPLTGKSIAAQRAMRELEPELKHIRENHKDDRQKQAQKTMELYQKHKVSPLSGCLPIFIQIPIIMGLYWVFLRGLKSGIDTTILYGFIAPPAALDMHFLVFDLAAKSFFLALLAGVTQYIQTHLSLGKQPPLSPSTGKASFQEDFARSMQMQMRYILPIMIGFIAYTTGGAVALYWATSNILSIGQELLMKRKLDK